MEQNEKEIVEAFKEAVEEAGGDVTSIDLPSTEVEKGRVNAGAVVLTVLSIGGAIVGIVKVGKWLKKRKTKKAENDDVIEYEKVEEETEEVTEDQVEKEPVKKTSAKKRSTKKKVEETKEETTE